MDDSSTRAMIAALQQLLEVFEQTTIEQARMLEDAIRDNEIKSKQILDAEHERAEWAIERARSLENSLLLEREHAGRIAAEAAGQRELLLGEATVLMSQTLDYQGVFGALAQLCARSFADWAVIDIQEEDSTVVRIGAHHDPSKQPLLREFTARYPLRFGTRSPIERVLRIGEVFVRHVLTDDEIRAYTDDDHHAEFIHQLGTRTLMSVPLRARDMMLGALTFASATPNRFGAADIEIAKELGRRAAMAIDNARLLAQTQRALRLREEFLHVASHELRTPLASLRLSVESLLRAAEINRQVSPSALDRNLRWVLNQTTRLEHLIGEMLDVTRIEQGRIELQLIEVALDALVNAAVDRLEFDIAAARSAVAIECTSPVIGRWDPSRLDQVITNLLSNALKFGAGKPIEIRIERTGDDAQLTVTDHGIGIDPARRPYVFDRFERAVPASSYGGLGLGLYIARSIVLAHSGAISVDSTPGEGSTFTVTLPCAGPAESSQGSTSTFRT